MHERLAALEAEWVFEASVDWPLGDRLPVRRVVHAPGGWETGYLRAGETVVNLRDGTPVGYTSFAAMAADGWRPD